ncbi:hypothetical protein [Sphingomicrobium clamense]|uniref:Uncharacterized protein n=1 Tax=Sphingomicrobium clamense TaxID=2851013 RepID=A0ABS6V840_9SPHN|nr:hypothetical protein [Sphingomicrobium sp. B8]MBW0145735.1 hypothetical protein [Sphingomicrobium sp. B8]
MARYEKELEAAGEAPLDIVEWISALAKKEGEKGADSHGAQVARMLSGLDCGETLGGAFAPSRLTGPKEK